MPEQPPTLRDMIQEALDAGRTLRDLEARAVDERGNAAKKDTIRKIANGLIDRMPLESHLRGIAASLGIPYERVRQAAINQWLPGAPTAQVTADAERLEMIEELRRIRADLDRALAELDRQEQQEKQRGTA
jgi:hypothetical protein